MPIAFQFNSTQLAEIQRLRDITAKVENKQLAGGGVALYSCIFNCVTGIDLTDDSLTGAVDTVLGASLNGGMPQSALINSPPSRFGGIALTSDNTLSLKLGEGYLPVPTNILVRYFKKSKAAPATSWAKAI